MTERGKRGKLLDGAIVVIACVMALYHFVSTQYLLQGALEHQIIHLGFALTLVFLTSIRMLKRRAFLPLLVTLLLAGLVVIIYMKIEYHHLERAIGFPGTIDMVIGILLLVVVIEAARQTFGPVLPVLAILSIIYFFFGQHVMWGGLNHGGFPIPYIISTLGIGFSGVFGLFLGVSANIILLFMVFGGIMQVVGVRELIEELGKLAGRVLAGGPAHTAVVGSSLIGTVCGSSVANVALTGAFTIPLMKKKGYHPNMAGAIEACASTGGQILPPIMGTAAFIMAAIIGVPYVKIMIVAVIPALLYYYSVGLAVQVLALKLKIPRSREAVDVKLILRRAPVFFIPLLVIIVLLVMRFSPGYAAFYAIVAVVVVSFVHRDTRLSPARLAQGVADGAVAGAKLAVTLAAAGIMAQVVITTGLGVKFTGLAEELAGGQLFVILLLTMAVSIILGSGLPTAAAYILVAVLIVPALVRMGVGLIPAHFFAFYFAMISTLTPPVALSCMAAVAISGGNYWKTSLESLKLAVPAFVLPFLMVYNPVFLVQGGEPLTGTLSLIAALIATSALIAVVQNHFLAPISRFKRVIYALCAVSSIGYIVNGNYLLLAIGTLLFTWLMVIQWRERRSLMMVN